MTRETNAPGFISVFEWELPGPIRLPGVSNLVVVGAQRFATLF